MPLPLVILWIAWGVQAVLCALQVRKFAKRFERPSREGFEGYRPPAAVIVPFKGMEPALQANVRSLFEQDYPDYRLVLVVESRDDPAWAALEAEAKRHPRPATILIAGLAGEHEGQKVHNQLAAMDHLLGEAAGEQVWVFADSDAVPGPRWLGDLIGPLAYDHTGVSTGYRWLIPPRKQHLPGVWSRLASVMNSSVACFAGRDEFNQAWGGSMALRVETAKEGNLLEAMRGSLSDDYAVSRMCRELGKRIYFHSPCLVASPVDFTWSSLANFARRQYLITRIHAPLLYMAALLMHTLYLAGWVSAWAALLIALTQESGVLPGVVLPGVAMVVVFLANQARATYRRRAVRLAFGQAMVEQLSPTLRLDRWATPLWMGLHWVFILSAAFGRTIRWRGNVYRLRGRNDVQRIKTIPDSNAEDAKETESAEKTRELDSLQ